MSKIKLPVAYDLKRTMSRYPEQSGLSRRELDEFCAAPVVVFADQDELDSDAVEQLSQRFHAEHPLRLPYDQVLFEIEDKNGAKGTIVTYAFTEMDGVHGHLFHRSPNGVWSTILATATFLPDFSADVVGHAGVKDADFSVYATVICAAVWRGVALLSQAAKTQSETIPVTRRPKLARSGVKGWSYHIVDVDHERLRAALSPQGGTHRSPRWHLRRGHIRCLRDGREIFVRACEVGDRARGGVVKDYVSLGRAA